MRWIDVSVPLEAGRPSWPGDEPFRYEETDRIATGAEANCARMSLSVHFGTHIDAPYHFIEGGKTVDELDLDLFVGPCLVVDVSGVEALIEPEHLAEEVPSGTRRLFVKSRNGPDLRDAKFRTDYVAFSPEAARWLAARDVRLLGFDYFSIASYGAQVPAHVAFLEAGGAIVECVDLSDVAPGEYQLACLPLRIRGSGGAPARAILGAP
ncbi:MAG: cyclase family protein [Planctomycetota bacterium]